MAYADDLSTARDNIARQIKEITTHPKPNYTIDGQTVLWSDHLRNLLDTLKDLDDKLATAEGPYEVRSIGIT